MSSYAPALHLREAFDPSTAALLVVDIQNYCCHRHGGLFRAQASQSLSEMGQVSGLSTEDWEYFWTRLDAVVLPNLNHLQDACRTRKLEVIFTVMASLTEDGRERSLDYKISGFHIPKSSWDAQVVEQVRPKGDEMVLPKTSSNVFVSTNIDYILRNLGVKHLMIAGGLTDQCVESAVRDACDLGYLVTLVTDACITHSSSRHINSLRTIKGYCRQRTTDELIKELATEPCKSVDSNAPTKTTFCIPKGVLFLRLLWCDTAGVRRCRVVPVQSLSSLGVGLTHASMAMPAFIDKIVPGCSLCATGEVRLVPELEAVSLCPWRPTHAMVVCNLMDLVQSELIGWEYCPRQALRGQVARLEQLGLELKVGFETEFYLLQAPNKEREKDPSAPLRPIDSTTYSSSLAYNLSADVLDDIANTLLEMNIEVEQMHSEAGPGQFEVVTTYAPVMQACDRLMYTREAIHAVAIKHGLRACFLPKLFISSAGNGAHMHMSLWTVGDAQNLMINNAINAHGQGFFAGILHHLPALMCFTCASPNSYRRIQPGSWSGAFRCWGNDNKKAAIRGCMPENGIPSRFELKTMDPTANPYLAAAAVVAAGIDGIETSLKLPSEVVMDPADMPEHERVAQGVVALPTSLTEAIAELQAAGAASLRKALGKELVRTVVAVRECEALHSKSLAHEQEVNELWTRY
mmetsp:Transcript_458/g.936  ORF Transcript_458/g.936 Transcript_458/m.936 type:complete len:688 (+) Transcript_458:98-2161(+)